MKETGKMICKAGMGNSFGLTEQFLRGILKMARNTKGYFVGQMETSMKDNSKTTK